MDKDYMLRVLEERIQELQGVYRSTFDINNYASYNSATVMRSKTLQQINTCKLLILLVEYMPDNDCIESADACKAFDRLTEPRRLK